MKIITCTILVVILTFTSAHLKGIQNNKIINQKTTVNERKSEILRNDIEFKSDGSYHYDFKTSNGIKRRENGDVDGSMQGFFSYTAPEGIEIETTYEADETGFHPSSDHIPQTPDYIVRALEYIHNHPYIEKDYYTGEVKQTSFSNKIQID